MNPKDRNQKSKFKSKSSRIMKFYQHEIRRKIKIIDKARAVLETVKALKSIFIKLFQDPDWIILLREEGISEVPKFILELLLTKAVISPYGLRKVNNQANNYNKYNSKSYEEYKKLLKKHGLESFFNSEALKILPARRIPLATLKILKNMKPNRQIDAIEQMNDVQEYSSIFACVLLIATPLNKLIYCQKNRIIACLSERQIYSMEKEIQKVEKRFYAIKGDYGSNMMLIALIKSYIRLLLSHIAVKNFLAERYCQSHKRLCDILKMEWFDKLAVGEFN